MSIPWEKQSKLPRKEIKYNRDFFLQEYNFLEVQKYKLQEYRNNKYRHRENNLRQYQNTIYRNTNYKLTEIPITDTQQITEIQKCKLQTCRNTNYRMTEILVKQKFINNSNVTHNTKVHQWLKSVPIIQKRTHNLNIIQKLPQISNFPHHSKFHPYFI